MIFSLSCTHVNLFFFNPWVKKGEDESFDVPMGCYIGEEVCKLIGIVLLHQLNDIIPKENLGLYRDDGLKIFKNTSGLEIDRKKITMQNYLKIIEWTLPRVRKWKLLISLMFISPWFRTFTGHTKSLIMIFYTLIRTPVMLQQ